MEGAERDAVCKLAAYLQVIFEKIPAADRERAGLELVDGLLEYRDVKSLKALLK